MPVKGKGGRIFRTAQFPAHNMKYRCLYILEHSEQDSALQTVEECSRHVIHFMYRMQISH